MSKIKKRMHATRRNKGIVLLFTMVVMIVVSSVVASYLGSVQFSIRSSDAQITDSQAVYLAEAGINYAIYNLKIDSLWTGTSSPIVMGAGTFSVSVVDIGAGEHRLTSTGIVNNLLRTVQQDMTATLSPKPNTWREI